MAGMGASASPAGSFPALAVVLALFMLGYIVWTTDRLTTLARARTTTADPDISRDPPAQGHGPRGSGPPPPGQRPGHAQRHRNPARPGRPLLAPKLAACGKIAMSIAMGYMLILML